MNMTVTYGEGFEPTSSGVGSIKKLQSEISKFPQYQPITNHHFHGGVYCREVFQEAGVLIIGAVHKKDHFFMVLSGTVAVTSEDGQVVETITGPHLIKSEVGTQRALYSVTDVTYMTIHSTTTTTVEDAESEMVEVDPNSMYLSGNIVNTQKSEGVACHL